jgi:hypothetical protein
MPYVQMPRCVLVFFEVVMMAVVSERWPVNVTVKSIQYSLVACLGACKVAATPCVDLSAHFAHIGSSAGSDACS